MILSQAVTETLFNKLVSSREENAHINQENQLLKIKLESMSSDMNSLNKTLLSTALGTLIATNNKLEFWKQKVDFVRIKNPELIY